MQLARPEKEIVAYTLNIIYPTTVYATTQRGCPSLWGRQRGKAHQPTRSNFIAESGAPVLERIGLVAPHDLQRQLAFRELRGCVVHLAFRSGGQRLALGD